jgi:hypothetical protein
MSVRIAIPFRRKSKGYPLLLSPKSLCSPLSSPKSTYAARANFTDRPFKGIHSGLSFLKRHVGTLHIPAFVYVILARRFLGVAGWYYYYYTWCLRSLCRCLRTTTPRTTGMALVPNSTFGYVNTRGILKFCICKIY